MERMEYGSVRWGVVPAGLKVMTWEEWNTDLCVGVWLKTWPMHVEFPHNAIVLEIGSCENDWISPMKAVRPDLVITAVDWREQGMHGGAAHTYGGNVLDMTVEPASFDAIVAISTIEHIGLGAYGDPIVTGGDVKAMALARRWIRPSGWMYLDVPYNPSEAGVQVVRGRHRRYGTDIETTLCAGWQVDHRAVHTINHPDSPVIAMVLRPA